MIFLVWDVGVSGLCFLMSEHSVTWIVKGIKYYTVYILKIKLTPTLEIVGCKLDLWMKSVQIFTPWWSQT